ncbi:MAG: hypothetical protein PVI90_10735 [Desulfobacteraceae bacterium]|jgi:hypothetical protein
MNKFFDTEKIDVGIGPIAVNTTKYSQYISLSEGRRVAFVFSIGAMAASATLVGQLYQATDAAGTSAKVVTNATCTITANTKVKEATVTLASCVATETVVINGLTFTAAAATDKTAREFKVGVSDTADAAELVTCINDTTYGVPGLFAESALGVVSLRASEPGDQYITVVGDTHATAATVMADAVIEIEADMLDIENDFDHVAILLTTSASMLCQVTAFRGRNRYTPVQYLGAYKTNVAS